jgi:hypothetical protein
VLFEARGDAAELLEIAEEPLDQVALAIKVFGGDALDAHPALRRDMGFTSRVAHEVHKRPAIIAAVGDHGAGWEGLQQDRRGSLVT